MSAQDMSALVSARLCHDLISPIGAISNGLELLQMSGGSGSAELELVSDSVSNAMAKIRFFRIAFGPSDPDAYLALDEAADITNAMYNGRLTVDWNIGIKNIRRPVAKMVFLSVLCLERSLPMGGNIRISMNGDTINLTADGRKTTIQDDLWSHARNGTPINGMRSESVQFALLRQDIVHSGVAFSAEFTDASAALSLSSLVIEPV